MHIKRMARLGEERGEGHHSKLSGIACITNKQCLTGNISRRTLQQMLEQRAEHLWECSECKDASL